MKVVFVNRYYAPDQSATSQILTDLATALAKSGKTVCVVSSRQLYEDAAALLPEKEKSEGVEVHRVWTSTFGRQNLFGRALDYASFYITATLCVAKLAGRGDVVVSKTDPPMLSVAVSLAAQLRGAKSINWLQDVFPEVAGALGHWIGRGLPGLALRWARNKSLNSAARNVVIGFRMRDRLDAQGIAFNVRVIPNWADGELVHPIEPDKNPLRIKWNLSEKFVIGYSGNMGRAHEFATILNAAELLRGDTAISFLFVGGGANRWSVEQAARQRGLENFFFKPYEPREALGLSLGVADVHLISLRPQLEGYVVPSKFYGIAAAGRPTIFVGDTDGEIGCEVQAGACGMCVAQGDFVRLASAIRGLHENAPLRKQMGFNARRVFETRFDRSVGIEKWCKLLEDVSGSDA